MKTDHSAEEASSPALGQRKDKLPWGLGSYAPFAVLIGFAVSFLNWNTESLAMGLAQSTWLPLWTYEVLGTAALIFGVYVAVRYAGVHRWARVGRYASGCSEFSDWRSSSPSSETAAVATALHRVSAQDSGIC